MENRNVFGLAPAEYRSYRPRYPEALFAHLAALCPRRRLALDCATGNGQAAVGLAERFERVVACDSSAEQIAHAIAHERVDYRIGSAEALPVSAVTDGPFDLVTVAQGAHWFDLPAFYAGIAGVSHADTVIAIWGYSYCRVAAAIDALVAERLLARIEPYWAEGNHVIVDKYRHIPFPFPELPWPVLVTRQEWPRETYMSYLRTWSAVKKLELAEGHDLVADLDAELSGIWPDRTRRTVEFELVGRIGRRL
jgi:SAM-dependent methyltransferase